MSSASYKTRVKVVELNHLMTKLQVIREELLNVKRLQRVLQWREKRILKQLGIE